MLKSIQNELRALSNNEIAAHSQRFFKTGKGEYGEGDVFLGIRVPVLRKLAKKYRELSLPEVKKLLSSSYHEERLTALIILVEKYSRVKSDSYRETIYKTYISNFKFINNWDLVDTTCHKIIGPHLEKRDRSILYKWVKSPHLWTRRIAIITTMWFIRSSDLEDAFVLAEELLQDDHDLIHKAVGWVLRECGKKDRKSLEVFLKKHYGDMPRTMLRYAIERLPEKRRKQYLLGKI